MSSHAEALFSVPEDMHGKAYGIALACGSLAHHVILWCRLCQYFASTVELMALLLPMKCSPDPGKYAWGNAGACGCRKSETAIVMEAQSTEGTGTASCILLAGPSHATPVAPA